MANNQFDFDIPLRIKPRVIITALGMVLIVVFAFVFINSGISYVQPEEVGVMVRNLTRTSSLISNPGYIFHMPLGADDVYTVAKTTNTFELRGDEMVRIKTREGADVFVDLQVTYRVDEASPEAFLRAMGPSPDFWRDKQSDVLRAVARSVIRDTLGRMTVEGMVNSELRSVQLNEALRLCNDALRQYGMEILMISSIHPRYSEGYDQRIRDRKEADQAIEKERSAQEMVRAEQERLVAASERMRSVNLTEVRGEQHRREIDAQGQADRIRALADGESQRILLDAEREYARMVADASAALAEGLNRAAGIESLANAYERGGLALVREALAGRYLDTEIVGRPYSLRSEVERVRIEPGDPPNAPPGREEQAVLGARATQQEDQP